MEADEKIASKFRRLIELRDSRDEAKAAEKRTEKAYREYEGELLEELDESPVKGTRKIDLGPPYGIVTFSPRETYYGRILDKEAALAYFEEKGEVQAMTEPKIRDKKLNELVRSRMEAHEGMPPGCDFYGKRGITITRRQG